GEITRTWDSALEGIMPLNPMQPKLYPRLLLAVLTGLNILNYIDRNVLFAVQSDIKKEFMVSDEQIGTLTTAFFITYMVAAPLIGWLGDRFPRKNLIVIGIFIWSGFTFLTWFVHDYSQLFFRHAIVGIGEASYATIAPTLIADSFPPARRGRMLSIFFLGLPVGSAAGYFVGGYIAHYFGWRAPFMAAGIPGFILAIMLWMLPEPPRGLHEEHAPVDVRTLLSGLVRNGAFLTATFGMAMYTFAIGGLQQWIPTFLIRVRGMDLRSANIDFGLITLFNGIVATLLGGWIGDRLLKRYFGAYYTFSGVAMLIAVPLMVAAIYTGGKFMFPAIFAAVFFILIGTGPTNAALVNSVSASIRSTALAVNVFVIHLLGDAFSPRLIGRMSDKTGSLQTAFWVAFAAAAISGLILLYGARFAPRFKTEEFRAANS
ncbi:MAG TPA: MFS transporter, partial [Candidatus Sulfotelmatobacter sp.]|nr:MFS transporter [Candidatus Sulfotelmatobacter sp.]